MMTYTVAIKNNVSEAVSYIQSFNTTCAQSFIDMVSKKIQEQVDKGWCADLLATLLSDESSIVHPLSDNVIRGHNLLWFHLFRVDENGDAFNVVAFLVIDLTTGVVEDCSDNIITMH